MSNSFEGISSFDSGSGKFSSDEERKMFQSSVDHVKELVGVVKM